jgi:hypothetical protein
MAKNKKCVQHSDRKSLLGQGTSETCVDEMIILKCILGMEVSGVRSRIKVIQDIV